uniref:Cytochrome b561 domain-containing protein n=1 Tax=Globisporangium ultimum (strain ATCC 200006 / CBS 805.95 / DAOM BR144) TaxID=431595 RepID=K3WWE6_GLOUD
MTITCAKKAEFAGLAALFLAPAATIWTHCAQDATLFALHPALNALAMLVCTPGGLYLILERKHVADHATRVWMTKLHLFVNVLAALLLSIAGIAVFVAKRATQERHFVSPHSWAAMTVGLLFTLNILQGLLLTFEGKCANWQWRDETHGLVGTLIYIGSAVTMVFGLDSADDTYFGGPEGVFRLKAMLVIAHAALLGKLLFISKTSDSRTSAAAPSTSPSSPQQTKKKMT